MITWQEFEKVDIRCGTILSAVDNTKARNPAYTLKIDFGEELGIKTSSAQIADLYTKEELVGKRIIGVVNFEPKYIAGVKSEVLVCGFYTPDRKVSVVECIKGDVQNGAKLG